MPLIKRIVWHGAVVDRFEYFPRDSASVYQHFQCKRRKVMLFSCYVHLTSNEDVRFC